jgi:prophage antirepressor-like protein
MNELTAFRFKEGQEVRTLERDGEPWFVAKDVCDILGHTNPTRALQTLDDDEKDVITRASDPNLLLGSLGGPRQEGGAQSLNIINESGLYNLIFRSNKPEAKRFRKWVTSEVLPAIRKTGAYAILKRDYINLQNVYNQTENYRMKYINLLDKLENEGMRVKEIWTLSRIDRIVLQKIRELLPRNYENMDDFCNTLPPGMP